MNSIPSFQACTAACGRQAGQLHHSEKMLFMLAEQKRKVCMKKVGGGSGRGRQRDGQAGKVEEVGGRRRQRWEGRREGGIVLVEGKC